jgi:parallel beta-helix repeat protein
MRSAGVPYTNGTVYIRVDGSVDPSGAPIWRQGDIYTLTNDIISDTAGIIIEADYVTLNGQGYSIEGTNKTGIGIDLSARQNVSITNTTIRNFDEGIHLEDSANNSLSANTITYNNHGISLCSSSLNRIANNTVDFNDQAGIWFWFLPQGNSNNAVIGNEVAYNGWCGIRLVASSSNVLRNNTILGSAANFGVEGWDESHYFNDVDNSNTVDGKPIYYWVNKRDLQVPTDAGFVALVNCTNMTVANLSIEYEMQGLVVEYTDNSRIENTTVSFCQEGIRLEGSSNNTVSENHVYGSGYGIGFRENAISSGNIVTHNELRSNADGILLWAAEENIIVDNEILNSWEFAVTCVSIQCPVSSNMIYHNNFINNLQRTYAYHAGQNEWDDGYPSSGNYWSDYNGIDLYRSPYQNETGSDGIGDTPYTIDSNNQDNYPLMGPFSNMDDISTVSNSTISSFQFSGTTISFNVNGEPDTTGFCTLTVQHSTMPPPYIVTVDGKPIQYTTIFENDTMSVIYFTYQHSTHEVTIIGAQSTSTQGGGGGRMPYMN